MSVYPTNLPSSQQNIDQFGPQNNQIWDVSILLNNQSVPIMNFKVESGAYGKIGTASITTSIRALKDNNININTINNSTVLGNYTPLTIQINNQTIFGGYYFHGMYEFAEDIATIVARDYSAPLFDTKASIASLNYQNATVSSIVQQIANQFNMSYFIQISNDPPVGTIVDQQLAGAVLTTYPQPLWNILVLLARASGAQVYTDPGGVLNFVDITYQRGSIHTYWWKPTPSTASSSAVPFSPLSNVAGNSYLTPMLDLHVLHQPQRNQNFSVVVISGHQQSTQTSVQVVTVAGQNITLPGGGTLPRGTYKASGSGASSASLLSSRKLGIPIYYSRFDGLTPTQAQARAQSIAQDIATRLFVHTGLVDGDPTLLPTCQVQVMELPATNDQTPLLGFAPITLTVQSVTHTFNMPQGDSLGGEHDGFLTQFKAMNLPPADGDTDALAAIGGSG